MRTLLASVALVLLAAALAAPTSAQQTEPQIRMTPSVTQVGLHENKTSGEVSFTVVNTGPVAGSVTLNAAPVDGWRFDWMEGATFNLAPNAQKQIALKVSAPASDESLDGVLRVTGKLTEANALQRESPPVTSDIKLSYTAPPAPLPPPPPPGTPWGPIAGVSAAVFLALFLLQTGSVRLEISSPSIEVTPAGSGYVRVNVSNRFWLRRQIHLRVRDVPSPAVAALSLAKVRLRRGESVNVPLLVKAPVDMPDGRQSISVQARAGPIGPWTTRRRVRLRVRSPIAPDAPLEQLAPVILQN